MEQHARGSQNRFHSDWFIENNQWFWWILLSTNMVDNELLTCRLEEMMGLEEDWWSKSWGWDLGCLDVKRGGD